MATAITNQNGHSLECTRRSIKFLEYFLTICVTETMTNYVLHIREYVTLLQNLFIASGGNPLLLRAVRVNNLGSSQSLKKTKINPITTRRDLHVKEIFVSEEYQLQTVVWLTTKFSHLQLQENVWWTVKRVDILILGMKEMVNNT